VLAGEPDGYQELSINIDTGGLAARRLIDRLAGEAAPAAAPAGAQ
jgi:vanillate O-demethylase monooxygenase subunit